MANRSGRLSMLVLREGGNEPGIPEERLARKGHHGSWRWFFLGLLQFSFPWHLTDGKTQVALLRALVVRLGRAERPYLRQAHDGGRASGPLGPHGCGGQNRVG